MYGQPGHVIKDTLDTGLGGDRINGVRMHKIDSFCMDSFLSVLNIDLIVFFNWLQVNTSNIGNIVSELFQENIVRGR